MTVGTLVLAVFIGWVVLAMYRMPRQVPVLQSWARAGEISRDAAVSPAQHGPPRPAP
jgi:hypothetical protein